MSDAPIRIALADDQALVRAGLRALLQQQGIEIVLEADDGQALLFPPQDATLHVDHVEAFLLHVDGCGVATTSAAAIHIIGVMAIELPHAVSEYFRVEPIEVGGAIKVVLGKLGGAAHIEQHGGGVGPCGLNKRFRLQRQNRRLGRATAAERQGGKEGEK